jgi:hypothetical protein
MEQQLKILKNDLMVQLQWRPPFIKNTKRHNMIASKMLDVNTLIYNELITFKKIDEKAIAEEFDSLINDICAIDDEQICVDVISYYEWIISNINKQAMQLELYEIVSNIKKFNDLNLYKI